MSEEHSNKSHEYDASITATGVDGGAVEAKDRGLFDFLGKKEKEKPQEEVIATEFDEKVNVSEPEPKKEEPPKEEEVKDRGLLDKLRRSDSSSSSSSDEEEGEGEEKKKKKEKKGLKEKIKEKISGDKEEEKKAEDTTVPVEVVHTETQSDEKKGFLDKIKEKLPGQQKKSEEVSSASPVPPEVDTSHTEAAPHEGEPKVSPKEKKGILEKIKEKLPGYHPKTEEEKEKEKESASHE